jgi:hypothetical protein
VVAEAHAPFGSLYHHFPGGKQQLADEAIRAGGAFFQALVTAVYDAESDPEASVRAVFEGAGGDARVDFPGRVPDHHCRLGGGQHERTPCAARPPTSSSGGPSR